MTGNKTQPSKGHYASDTVRRIDLNSDMGEGAGNDSLLMPFISSANIACGFHAGDKETIGQTIKLAIKHGVAIGAHVSFRDKERFGRSEMNLAPGEIYELVLEQLKIMAGSAALFNIRLNHVKPHGALYNMSAREPEIAKAIAKAVKDFDDQLALFGLSGSCSVDEAKAVGLRTASEVFADRTYREDGSLTPRSQPNALIEDPSSAVSQVLQMLQEKTVTAISGKKVPIVAETICIHGDGKHAVDFARHINLQLKQNNIVIQAI